MKKYLITLILFLGFYGVSSALNPVKVAIVNPGATNVQIYAEIVDYDGPTTEYTQTLVGTFSADDNGIISFRVGVSDQNWDNVVAANIDGSWVLNIYTNSTTNLYAQYRLDQLIIDQSGGLLNMDDNGNLVPDENDTQSLGTDGNRWSEIFVTGGSVHVGPSGGTVGNTEMYLDYSANTGSIYVDGSTNSRFDIDAGSSNINLDADANGNDEIVVSPTTTTVNSAFNVPSGTTSLGGVVNVTGASMNVTGVIQNVGAGDPVTIDDELIVTSSFDAQAAGNTIGDNTAANQLTIDGDPTAVALTIDGDIDVGGGDIVNNSGSVLTIGENVVVTAGIEGQGGNLTLGQGAATNAGQVVLHDGDGGTSFTGTINTVSPLGADRTYTLPDDDGTLALTTSTDLQTAYNNGNTITTSGGNDIQFSGSENLDVQIGIVNNSSLTAPVTVDDELRVTGDFRMTGTSVITADGAASVNFQDGDGFNFINSAVNAQAGLNVTNANLDVGGGNFTVTTAGVVTAASDVSVGGDFTSSGQIQNDVTTIGAIGSLSGAGTSIVLYQDGSNNITNTDLPSAPAGTTLYIINDTAGSTDVLGVTVLDQDAIMLINSASGQNWHTVFN